VVGGRHVASIKAGVEAGASGVTSNAAGSVAGADCGGQNGNGEYERGEVDHCGGLRRL
jgi:hypothetical protein